MRRSIAASIALSLFSPLAAFAASPAPAPIEFNREIRPVLSDACFHCHGPDERTRKAKLRLDTPEGLYQRREDYAIVVPGKPDESELLRRITTQDEDDRMPPADSHKTITPKQIAAIRTWIEQGAPFQSHWAFIPPKRGELPQVSDKAWPRNGIDHFVLARLDREGLKPSPEAEKATLIRRVTLDLTGLPPTPAEVDAFLADTSPDAYEKVVDRLLASPRYGEHMAGPWLDAARYADTSGYQADWERFAWPWRDWVVRAFNDNMPFDRFTIEQLAGDQLPDATLEQKLATAFNRNHRINDEAGIIQEEYLVEYAVDRVETTTTVFMGMTIGCARCHDHKFDPVSQREFYELFAYFNNIPEKGQDGRAGYAAPFIRVPALDAKEKATALDRQIAALHKKLAADDAASASRLAAWEQKATASGALDPWQRARAAKLAATGAATIGRDDDDSLIVRGTNADAPVYEVTLEPKAARVGAVRLEVLLDESLVKGPGRSPTGNYVLTEFELDVLKPGAKTPERVKIKSAAADYSQKNWPVLAALDGKKDTGWAVDGDVWREEHVAVFHLESPIDTPAGTQLVVRMRHESPKHKKYSIGRFRLTLAEQPDAPLYSPPAEVVAAMKVAAGTRSESDREAIAEYFRSIDPGRERLRAEIVALQQSLQEASRGAGTQVMVMAENARHKDTYLLKRGQYDQPDKSQKLSPGVPKALSGADTKRPANRLELAQWLVSGDNPLTARVAVNRYWLSYFGVGLVKTAEDFGAQGEWPSHPELLDWLATEFPRLKWDVKAMQKLIVTSATYRQSSRITPQLLERDPENRLLARGPRFRLDAYGIRDNALAIGGLLVNKLGGPPVKPYQPAGLWEELSFGNKTTVDKYVQDKGDALYRRGLYVFWKRSVPPPGMMAFDAAGREACQVRTSRTNTPLQALNLLNDITYVEAARAMAQRMMTEGGTTPAERLTYGWRLAMARKPSERELASLMRGFEDYLAEYKADVAAAKALLKVGESPRNEKLDPSEHAAYMAVANVLLNLDETVTKE